MPPNISRWTRGWLCALLFASAWTWAQQTSANLTGVCRDRQDAAVPNAKITLSNQERGATIWELTSDGDGSFRILALNPATYTLVIEATGFKKFEQKDIKLFPGDRINLSGLVLDVGSLSDTVPVEAQVVQLETESGARSGIVTGNQVINLALNGVSNMDAGNNSTQHANPNVDAVAEMRIVTNLFARPRAHHDKLRMLTGE